MKKDRFLLLPLMPLLAAVLIYLLACAGALIRDEVHRADGGLQWRVLQFSDFESESVVNRANDYGSFDLISTDPDPQMVYRPGGPFRAQNFNFRAAATNRPGGEMTLYYTTRPDEPFSEGRRIWAERQDDGTWTFDLGGRTYYALRFDPDTTGAILWRDWEVTLNEPEIIWQYFIPDARDVFLMLLASAVCAAVLAEGAALLRAARGLRDTTGPGDTEDTPGRDEAAQDGQERG